MMRRDPTCTHPALILLVLGSLTAVGMASNAAGDNGYEVELTAPTTWIDRGEGITLTVRVLHEGEPAPNAEVVLSALGAAHVLVTNDDGIAQSSLYRDREVGQATATATLRRAHEEDTSKAVTAPEARLDLAWTEIVLTVRSDVEAADPGDEVAFSATAHWAHDGSPIPDLPVRFQAAEARTDPTDTSGNAHTSFRMPSDHALRVTVDVDMEDRPHGIRTASTGPVMVSFRTGDQDGDGVADHADNCPQQPNGDQRDADKDDLGDACDATDDRPSHTGKEGKDDDDQAEGGKEDDQDATDGERDPTLGGGATEKRGAPSPAVSLLASGLTMATLVARRRWA